MPFAMFCLGTQNKYQSSSLTFPGERIRWFPDFILYQLKEFCDLKKKKGES